MTDPMKVDANQLLQDWKAQGLSADAQQNRVTQLLNEALPYVLVLAHQAREMQVAPKTAAIKKIARMLKDFPREDQLAYARQAAKAAKVDIGAIKELLKPSK